MRTMGIHSEDWTGLAHILHWRRCARVRRELAGVQSATRPSTVPADVFRAIVTFAIRYDGEERR